jgi:hemolysin activation/secretion protein
MLNGSISVSQLGKTVLACAAGAAAAFALAQPVSDAELTRRQARQIEEAQGRIARPDATTLLPEGGAADVVPPLETPCFLIREIVWHPLAAERRLQESARGLVGKCVGAQGLRLLQDALTRKLIQAGHITSRVLVPQQNLGGGTLNLELIEGRFSMLREQGPAPGRSALLFPMRSGDVLDQRGLDQALENARRLASQQAVEFDLLPGANAGDTDVLIKHTQAKPWRAVFTADDSGAGATGKYQLGAVVGIDSPLGLYDMLTITLNRNANIGNHSLGTQASSIAWSMPAGYWSFLLGANQSTYKQTVAGFNGGIVYGGRSVGMEIGIGVVPYRSAETKGALQFKLNRKVSRSRIDDADIDVQFRDVLGYEASYAHRQYLGGTTLDLSVGLKGSLPNRSKAPGVIIGAPEWDGHYRLATASANLALPFRLGQNQLRYQSSLRGQRAMTLLPVFESFSVGGRYSVRGFDGASTLASENGWLWRNELSWLPANSQLDFMAGLDAGRVGGPAAATLLGRSLAGAVLGLRGRSGPDGRFNFDITLGCPLNKPAGFHTRPIATTASLGAEF